MTQEYTLHKLPEGFIVTSNEEIKKDELPCEVLDLYTNKIWVYRTSEFGSNASDYFIKIIAQQPQIIFSSLKEEEQVRIGWFDVEKLAEDYSRKEWENLYSTKGITGSERGWETKDDFKAGFQKCLELLSDRKFTEEDMRKALKLAWLEGHDNRLGINRATREEWENTTIRYLSQQSWRIQGEWASCSEDIGVCYEKCIGKCKFKIKNLL